MSDERTPYLPWHHPAWAEDDTEWARGCRLLQGWWRSQLEGPVAAGLSTAVGGRPQKLVVSMIPAENAHMNFLSDGARQAFESWATDGAGLVGDDRARRNLMSSQPLAFNLFGPFVTDGSPLLSWIRTIDTDATDVVEVRLEWAPPRNTTFGGGSAFDVFISYSAETAQRFLGIECKYAENLASSSIKSIVKHQYTNGPRKGQRPESYVNYEDYTQTSGHWKPGASDHLDTARLRQIWLNVMLAQRVSETREYDGGTSVMLTCQDDHGAWAATREVRRHLTQPAQLRWTSYEALLGTLHGVEWAPQFVNRYLNFGPVREHLGLDDPRR
jgi:hypothetical protein